MEIWEGKKLQKEDASKLSGIKNIMWEFEFERQLERLIPKFDYLYINLEEEGIFLKHSGKNVVFANKLKERYPAIQVKSITPLIHKLRLVKHTEEIDLIQKACSITKTAFEEVLKTIKPGQFEYEIEATLISNFIKKGANGYAYEPIVASGKNACTLHYVYNDKKTEKNDLVLMDFGAEYGNYAADCSRTIPASGKFTKRQKEVYESVLKVFKEVKKLFIPGNTINDINTKTNKLIEKELIKLKLISKEDIKNQTKENPAFKRYFMHGTSHFMGLDVHDVGTKDIKLEKGMVLTCEPGIYIEEESIGIRLENDILVDDKPIDLMEDIPIEADEIEELMNKK
jgi:Xaa-Pro aminopeptidase